MKQYSRLAAWMMFGSAQILASLIFSGSPLFAADSAQTTSYVRISRAFFEKPLQAQVKLSSPTGGSAGDSSYSSTVQWVQYPPTAPAPQQSDPELGQVLADFRDFVACAEMPSLGESRLCFKVMADVSSLGVNDNEMTLRGIDTISSETVAAQCPSASNGASSGTTPAPAATTSPRSTPKTAADGGPPSRYKLQKATVSANSLQLDFKYSDGCGPNVQLTLTQVP